MRDKTDIQMIFIRLIIEDYIGNELEKREINNEKTNTDKIIELYINQFFKENNFKTEDIILKPIIIQKYPGCIEYLIQVGLQIAYDTGKFILKKISPYLEENLKLIGKIKILLGMVSLDEIFENKFQFNNQNISAFQCNINAENCNINSKNCNINSNRCKINKKLL